MLQKLSAMVFDDAGLSAGRSHGFEAAVRAPLPPPVQTRNRPRRTARADRLA